MNIKDSMKHNVISIHKNATLYQAAELIIKHHIGTLPVVDDNKKLIGILKMEDILSIIMPDFVGLTDNYKFLHDFGAFESRRPDPKDLNRPISEIMEAPIFAEESWSILHAIATIHTNNLMDLPVVDASGKLVGIASRVDIGTALIANWNIVDPVKTD